MVPHGLEQNQFTLAQNVSAMGGEHGVNNHRTVRRSIPEYRPLAEPETIAAEDMPGPEPEPASAPSMPASHEVIFRPKTEAKRAREPA
ncbi:hypothetical protein NW754_014527 [Fusarium falciforme]|nr:hypothetical protein NW754_014527 [Fusarium falciforme]KAJ4196189.1 hypothetical protein NW767_009649 [Fusarium falciforme]KAJ4243021.1 hypothetical protein NW757_011552 [Fusarium falciforme]